MNYYEHHIGDYAAATGHLSLIEDAVYSRMLRRYYLQEGPLPGESRLVARLVGARSADELEAVEAILAEFFVLQEDGWHQKRADEDISKFHAKQGKARASAEARWSGKQTCERNANAMPSHSERNAHQTPDTNHQEPEDQKQGADKPPALTLPAWLPESAWADWHKFRNQRKGWTPKARELSLASLARLYAKGHDPTAVIEQSIERGWTGLFELKNTVTTHAANQPTRKLSAVEQVEQAIRERREREPFDDEDAALAQIGYG